MPFYRMRTPNDCGPCALAWAYSQYAGIPFYAAYEQVERAWFSKRMFDQNVGRLDDLTDTPGEHERVAEKLKLPFRLATLGELQRGELPAERTVMLAHPWAEAPFRQHWIVLKAYSSDGHTVWHWGDGTTKVLNRYKLVAWYSDHAPACIYVIGETGKRLPWYARFAAWVARKLFA